MHGKKLGVVIQHEFRQNCISVVNIIGHDDYNYSLSMANQLSLIFANHCYKSVTGCILFAFSQLSILALILHCNLVISTFMQMKIAVVKQ